LFPGAPQPFIDLSTGINPVAYRVPALPAALFTRLPSAEAASALAEIAARAYGAPSAAHVLVAPGTQILLPMVAGLLLPGRAAVVSPAYGELARAAELAGHSVVEISDIAAAGRPQLIFVGNPNNPNGRLFAQSDLLAVADGLQAHGGLLAVDEAFMDVGPTDASLAPHVSRDNIVVLRSFGKFFGLPGLRLGFALASPPTVARIAGLLGPWAVSGAALAVGAQALADTGWIEKARSRLAKSARRLDRMLTGAGLDIVGGTALFRLVRTPAAGRLFRHLGRAGILVRHFPQQTNWLRFGLPANEPAWRRLRIALAASEYTR